MTHSSPIRLASLRAIAVGLLAGGLLLPGAVLAAPGSQPGTLVGTVTCGEATPSPVANIVVSAEGMDLSTHSDDSGKFSLSGVPAGQMLTIEAVANSGEPFVGSRFDVVLQPGQTLDVGALAMPVCPQVVQPAVQPDNVGLDGNRQDF